MLSYYRVGLIFEITDVTKEVYKFVRICLQEIKSVQSKCKRN
jgi:hypothetical protein